MNNLINVLLICSSGLSSVLGQFLLKTAVLKNGALSMEQPMALILLVNYVIRLLWIPQFIIGIAAYGLGLLLYIVALTRMPISIVSPSLSIAYVLTVLIGKFAFSEFIPATRYFGVCLIVSGVILVAHEKS